MRLRKPPHVIDVDRGPARRMNLRCGLRADHPDKFHAHACLVSSRATSPQSAEIPPPGSAISVRLESGISPTTPSACHPSPSSCPRPTYPDPVSDPVPDRVKFFTTFARLMYRGQKLSPLVRFRRLNLRCVQRAALASRDPRGAETSPTYIITSPHKRNSKVRFITIYRPDEIVDLSFRPATSKNDPAIDIPISID